MSLLIYRHEIGRHHGAHVNKMVTPEVTESDAAERRLIVVMPQFKVNAVGAQTPQKRSRLEEGRRVSCHRIDMGLHGFCHSSPTVCASGATRKKAVFSRLVEQKIAEFYGAQLDNKIDNS